MPSPLMNGKDPTFGTPLLFLRINGMQCSFTGFPTPLSTPQMYLAIYRWRMTYQGSHLLWTFSPTSSLDYFCCSQYLETAVVYEKPRRCKVLPILELRQVFIDSIVNVFSQSARQFGFDNKLLRLCSHYLQGFLLAISVLKLIKINPDRSQ